MLCSTVIAEMYLCPCRCVQYGLLARVAHTCHQRTRRHQHHGHRHAPCPPPAGTSELRSKAEVAAAREAKQQAVSAAPTPAACPAARACRRSCTAACCSSWLRGWRLAVNAADRSPAGWLLSGWPDGT